MPAKRNIRTARRVTPEYKVHRVFGGWLALLTTVVIILTVMVLYSTMQQRVAFAYPTSPDAEGWVTDGTGSESVGTITSDSERTYIAGNFTYVGEHTGATVTLDTTTGLREDTPKLNLNTGSATAVEPDGSGGWYVAGSFRTSLFSNVDGTLINNVVHIKNDGTFDTGFSVGYADSSTTAVNDLVLDTSTTPDTLYIGGSFNNIDGSTRNDLAAVNAVNGDLLSWNPGTNALVNAMALNGDRLYVTGTFSLVGAPNGTGQSRIRLAAIGKVGSGTIAEEAIDVWAPRVCNTGESIAVKSDGSAVFVGGIFTTVGSSTATCPSTGTITRNRLAAFDGANSSNAGTVDADWNPNLNGTPEDLILNAAETTLYAGGAFTSAGGATHNRIAAMDTDLSVVSPVSTTWVPSIPTGSSSVFSLAIEGANVIAGGSFTTVGDGTTRRYRLAKFDGDRTGTGTLQSWDPKVNGTVNAVAVAGSDVYVAGDFSSVNGYYRTKLAAFDNDTMDLDLGFDPGTVLGAAGTDVWKIVLHGSYIYAGGDFTTTATNNAGTRLARFDKETGTMDTGWDPRPSNTVQEMLVDANNANTLYVGGTFANFNPGGSSTAPTITVDQIAKLDLTVNTATTNPADPSAVIAQTATWNPTIDGSNVDGMVQDDTNLYFAGNFTALGTGADRTENDIQKISKSNGQAASGWISPVNNGTITFRQITISDDKSQLYVALDTDLVRLSTTDGTADNTWFSGTSNTNAGIAALFLDDAADKVYVGGNFTTIGGQSRQRLAEVGTNGTVASWNPGFDTWVTDIHQRDNVLIAGGLFTTSGVGGTSVKENRPSVVNFSTNTIGFTTTSSSGGEALTPANLEVSLAATDASDTTVQYSVTGGSASGSGVDYTLASGTATVTAGNLTTNIPITIVNDSIDESDETIVVTLSSPSSNAALGTNTAHTYTIQDNDTVGVTIAESSGATNVTEAGGTDTYTVVLNSQPSNSVSIAVTGDAQASGAPTPLTFTTGNWNTPQTVTVSATNDAVAEGAHTGTLTHAATSSDSAYNGIGIASVTANITDNDTAGVSISETGGSTNVTEGGATDSYSVVLTSQPTDTVSIALSFNGQINATPSPLSFTTGNWSTPQLVTVNAIDDASIEGPHSANVSHAATSSDSAYNGISIASVTANITDNDTAGVTVNESGGSTQVTEGSTTDSYTVVLNTQPSATVTVNVTGDAQVSPDQSSLTFTTSDWNTPQTIVATPTNDVVAEGLHSGTITHSATSADGSYNGISIASVVVSITDNDSPGVSIVQSGGGTTATEGGAGDSYTVVLTTQPTDSVSIALTPNAEVTAGPSPLTFTTGNWSTPQTVTVNAVNDAVADSGDLGSITHAATSSDGNYNGISIASVSVSITDNDTAGITVTQSGGSTNVTEGGATDSYTVVLTSEPTANVVVTLTPDSQVGATPSPLTFTTGNWSTPQTVTVSASNDAVAEGSHLGSVSQDVASSDGNYNNFSLSDITVTVTDNDTAGVTVTQSGGSTQATEGGSGDTYSVVLTSEPTANVTITTTPDADVTAAPPTLTFTSGNWNTPQTVTVGAVNDAIAEGNHVGIITNAASSADSLYNGASAASVTVMVADNDTAGVVVTESGGSTNVTEGGATDTYTVVLTSQPTADVQIVLNVVSQVTTSPSTLLFTSGDWNVPQSVIVTAVDDSSVEGTHATTITQSASSGDPVYSGIAVDDVAVTITDDDAAPPGPTTPPSTPSEPPPSDDEDAPSLNLLGGSSAREHSIAVSRARFVEPGSANGVVIATERTAVDAYTASPLVTQNNYALMLSDGKNASADTLLEMIRVTGYRGKPVYLAGGTAALSEQVELDIRAAGFTNVLRLAGPNRRRTAELIAEAVAQHNPQGRAETIILSEDTELIDGLSAGSAAGTPINGQTMPILITLRGAPSLDPTVVSFVKNHSVKKVYLMGGTVAVPTSVEQQLVNLTPNTEVVRLSGADRYATNFSIVERFFPDPTAAVVVRGDRASIPGAQAGVSATGTTGANTLVTALLANTLGGQIRAPVLLVTATTIPQPTEQYLNLHQATIERLYIVADFAALSDAVVQTLSSYI